MWLARQCKNAALVTHKWVWKERIHWFVKRPSARIRVPQRPVPQSPPNCGYISSENAQPLFYFASINLLWLFVPRESLRPCRSCDTSILASNLSGKKEMLLGLHTLLIHLDTLGKLHRVEVHSNAREMQLICYKNSNRNNANPSSTKRNPSKHRNETGDFKQQHGSEGR